MKLDNLKAIRKEKHLSRKELAKLSGINENTIVAIESGKTNVYEVKLNTLVSLAKALKVKVRNIVPNDLKEII